MLVGPLWIAAHKGVVFTEKPTAPGQSDWRTGFDVSVHMEYSGRVAWKQGVLFENSIVCLVVFVCCCFCHASFSRLGVWLFLYASFDWLLGQIVLIR
ncbi:hypothetical protein, partial [Mycobacterium sp.]|uniref:hypothetical protein n=1 Tax=Mycobacterium sp. TaxID=1785 RepID=UPI002D96B2E0|nr:hypothetical protein [Mycobacterium sp.]